MKPKHLVSIFGNLGLIALLSGCGATTSGVEMASTSIQRPPVIEQLPAIQPTPAIHWPTSIVENEKGDGAFKAYDYY